MLSLKFFLALLAIGNGIYYWILRSKNPEKLDKLKSMQDRFGEKKGIWIHIVFYSISPFHSGLLSSIRNLHKGKP